MHKTPAEIWLNQKPNLTFLRIFGSICYNHIPIEKRTKLDAKTTKCIFLGYASPNTYRLWDVEANKLVIGRNVTFNEEKILNQRKIIQISDSEAASEPKAEDNVKKEDLDKTLINDDTLLDISSDAYTDAEDTSLIHMDNAGKNQDNKKNNTGATILRRSERNRQEPDRYGQWVTHFAFSTELFVENAPTSIREAKQREDWSKWKEAIDNYKYSR